MRMKKWAIALTAAVVLVLAGCGSGELKVEEVLKAFEKADLGIGDSQHVQDIFDEGMLDMAGADEADKEEFEEVEGIMFERSGGGPIQINIIAEVNDKAERDEIMEEFEGDEMAQQMGMHVFTHKNIVVMMVGLLDDDEVEKFKKTLKKL